MKKQHKLADSRRSRNRVDKLSTYRVWLEQVNQTYVDVRATDEDDARKKGYRKWRREYSETNVADIKLLESNPPD